MFIKYLTVVVVQQRTVSRSLFVEHPGPTKQI